MKFKALIPLFVFAQNLALASPDPVWQKAFTATGNPEAKDFLTPAGIDSDFRLVTAVRVGPNGAVHVASPTTLMGRPNTSAGFYPETLSRPAARIRKLALDTRGQEWVATAAGLAGPDGRTYLAGEDVTAVVVGPDGTTWAGTDGAIVRIPSSGSPLRLSQSAGVPTGQITDLAIAASGTVYALIMQGGVAHLIRGNETGFVPEPAGVPATDTTDWGGLAAVGSDLIVGRWIVGSSGILPLPLRDKNVFTDGLKCPQVVGLRTIHGGWMAWYGTAGTGLTVHANVAWQDHLRGVHVFDADQDAAGTIWAATDVGLVRVTGDSETLVPLPEFAPGNALGGIFTHDGSTLVFGPRGLFSIDRGGKEPGGWKHLVSANVVDAHSTVLGPGYLRPPMIWFYPSTTPLSSTVPSGAQLFSFVDPEHVYLATPVGLFSFTAGQRGPILEAMTQATPLALAALHDEVCMATAAPRAQLWIGERSTTLPGRTLKGKTLPIPARCFLTERDRILTGTDDGLGSIEDHEFRWFYRKAGLSINAIVRVGSFYLLATNRGLVLLDGPSEIAINPLGAGDGPDRVTGMVLNGTELWVTTAGLGLVRYHWQPPVARRRP